MGKLKEGLRIYCKSRNWVLGSWKNLLESSYFRQEGEEGEFEGEGNGEDLVGEENMEDDSNGNL